MISFIDSMNLSRSMIWVLSRTVLNFSSSGMMFSICSLLFSFSLIRAACSSTSFRLFFFSVYNAPSDLNFSESVLNSLSCAMNSFVFLSNSSGENLSSSASILSCFSSSSSVLFSWMWRRIVFVISNLRISSSIFLIFSGEKTDMESSYFSLSSFCSASIFFICTDFSAISLSTFMYFMQSFFSSSFFLISSFVVDISLFAITSEFSRLVISSFFFFRIADFFSVSRRVSQVGQFASAFSRASIDFVESSIFDCIVASSFRSFPRSVLSCSSSFSAFSNCLSFGRPLSSVSMLSFSFFSCCSYVRILSSSTAISFSRDFCFFNAASSRDACVSMNSIV